MNPTEKISHRPLACFKKENLKFFHTGDFKRYVLPVTSEDYNPYDYSLITFHIFIQNTFDNCFLLQKIHNTQNPPINCTFSIHIEYSHPFTYEYMEAFVTNKFTQILGLNIEDIRFHKMQLENTPQGTVELVYYLLGIVHTPIDNDLSKKFTILTRDQLLQANHDPSLKLWKEILGLFTSFSQRSFSSIVPTGLIIGRFQPIHMGHLFLIKKTFESISFLKIGIGSSQIAHQSKNPFTFDERKHLIELTLNDENIPQNSYQIYPIPDLFDFDKWITSIFEIVDQFDVIFTNNLWIGRLIQKRGKVLNYGWKYNFSKYNGTYIRKLLKTHNSEWKTLVPPSIIPFLESWNTKKPN